MALPAIVISLILLALALPIFLVFGLGSSAIAVLDLNLPWTTLIQISMGAVSKQVLIAIPLFIFAGSVMLRGGAARRLVDFCIALVGHLSGGLGIAMVLAMGFFAAFCGSILAAITAVGTILMPVMVERGYSRAFVVVLAAAAGLLEALIPPSNAAIIYSSLTSVPVSATFAAGILPGLLLMVLLIVYVMWRCRRMERMQRASRRTILRTGWQALPALFTPVIIMGGIYAGLLTPSETAAVAGVWGMLIGAVVYRELTWRGVLQALRTTAETSAIIFIIIAMASFMSVVMTYTRAPQDVIGFFSSFDASVILVMAMIGVAVLILGTFLEIIPVFLLTIPIIVPLSQTMDIDLLHFYVFFTGVAGLGLLTPPVCVGVYTASAVINEPPNRAFTAIGGFLMVGIVYAAIVLMVPGLATWLPGLLR